MAKFNSDGQIQNRVNIHNQHIDKFKALGYIETAEKVVEELPPKIEQEVESLVPAIKQDARIAEVKVLSFWQKLVLCFKRFFRMN
jgi:hypothetical protein